MCGTTSVVYTSTMPKLTRMTPKPIHHDKLPESILLKIFHLFSFKDLGRASMVCTQWRRIAHDHSLWRDADLRGLNLTAERTVTLIDRISSSVLSMNLNGCPLTVSFITAVAEKCSNLKSLRCVTRVPANGEETVVENDCRFS